MWSNRLRLLMIANSPHYVVSTATTRFDDGEKFLTAELARAAHETNDDEGTHGFVAADADSEAEDDPSEGREVEEDEVEEGVVQGAAANPATEYNWGMFLDMNNKKKFRGFHSFRFQPMIPTRRRRTTQRSPTRPTSTGSRSRRAIISNARQISRGRAETSTSSSATDRLRSLRTKGRTRKTRTKKNRTWRYHGSGMTKSFRFL